MKKLPALAYQELRRMTVLRVGKPHGQRTEQPWVHDRQKLLQVVLEKLRRNAFNAGLLSAEEVRAALALPVQCALKVFDAALAAKPKAGKFVNRTEHIRILRLRPPSELYALILWKLYRLGENSVDVAQSLGVSPCYVRQTACRLVHCARALGFETAAPRGYGGALNRREWRRHQLERANAVLDAPGRPARLFKEFWRQERDRLLAEEQAHERSTIFKRAA